MGVRDGRENRKAARYFDKQRQKHAGRARAATLAGHDFTRIYEDAHLLAVAKPPGILVTQAEGNERSLADLVQAAARAKSASSPVPAPVHRLDRYTSGIVLFGKGHESLDKLSALFRDDAIQKNYTVLAVGVPEEPEGEFCDPLEEINIAGRRSRIALDPMADRAMPAQTSYELTEQIRLHASGSEFSLLDVVIEGGRTHQIRVHLAHADIPVAGDKIYGDKAANRLLRERFGLERQFLHASGLSFIHPYSQKPMNLQCPLPPDLMKVLSKLRFAVNPPPVSAKPQYRPAGGQERDGQREHTGGKRHRTRHEAGQSASGESPRANRQGHKHKGRHDGPGARSSGPHRQGRGRSRSR